ncbi:hypothetical protein LWM68_20215 [Niabella sp. W65]|nr:hypothetical protein [Niabella sp. W65]MCH7364881.1 hypothetical protein [Niabella sp. W65]ULT40715.1 hypothetical protein KRR40_39140 [Niabella sp. I65]
MSQGIIPDPDYEGGGTDTVIVPTIPVHRVIKEYIPFVPLTSVSNVTSATYSDRVALTRYYRDGFNSAYKSVAKDNVSGRNIISFSENYPRQELKGYLPFPSDDNVAREDLVEEQNSYYGTAFPVEVSSGDAHAYTVTDITSGSTARSHKVYAPARSWWAPTAVRK